MNLESLVTFLDMGGYGVYVWPAYVITFVVLIGVAVATVRSGRARAVELAALQMSFGSRRRAAMAAGQAGRKETDNDP
ncbi:MAG: heme exporter protein CcmD [Alphaproteobacteria bacterium]